jgi:hypothetical protein
VSTCRQFCEERFVIGGTAEVEKDRSEPYSRENINRREFLQCAAPYVVARHFPLARFLEFALYAIDQATNGLCRDGTLYAGMLNTSEQLVAIVLFSPLVSLDDSGQDLLDTFPRREASSTFVAFPAASNFRSVTCETRIDDSVAVIRTEGTLHRSVRFVPAPGIEWEATAEVRGFGAN